MRPVLAACAAALISLPAMAQVVRCDLADGRVAYQTPPCESGTTSHLRAADAPASDEGPAFPPMLGDRDLEVTGDSKFQTRVREALRLLQTKDPRTYAVVIGYVGKIVQAPHSGMNATATIPTFNMSDPSAMASITWAASSIAHDAYHSKLYHDHKGAHPNERVPDNIWTGNVAEAKCIKFQIASMRRIRAPQREIDTAAVQFQGYYANTPANKRRH